MDPTNVENGRGKVPHDPSLPFASTFSGLSSQTYLLHFQKEILLEGSLVRPFGLRTNIPVLITGAASVPSMSLPLLPVDQFKHLVSKMVKKFNLFVVFSHLNHGKHFQNIQK